MIFAHALSCSIKVVNWPGVVSLYAMFTSRLCNLLPVPDAHASYVHVHKASRDGDDTAPVSRASQLEREHHATISRSPGGRCIVQGR